MEGTKVKIPARKKARIEIIPLIDVIFFLLATFVLFTLSLNRIQSVPVDLPVAAPPKEKPPKDDSVTIQISGDGAIFWNRELIDMNEVPSRIAYYKTQTEDPRILIAGDEKARFGLTVSVLDEVRKAGITKFSVETRTRQTGK
jgi:biopolymer transport protein ExbD